MATTSATQLETRIESLKPMLLAGLVEHYDCNDLKGIPAQWDRFRPNIDHVPNQVGHASYGAIFDVDRDKSMDYMTAVEVGNDNDLPKGFRTLRVPSQRYVVFQHRDNIRTIQDTYAAIWDNWFPASEEKPTSDVSFERYTPQYNPKTGEGGFEIWIPVQG